MTCINQIDTSTEEGKLLMAALAKLTSEGDGRNQHPDDVLRDVSELAEKMYTKEDAKD